MIYDHTADAMQIGTGSATRLKIDSGGDIDVETGDIFFSTAGKGIVLGATSNTDANTLDDYEEGTWTASIDTAGGSVTLASGTDLCSYTKIGNMVTVRGKIAVDSISSHSGAANMIGLPFTSTNKRSGLILSVIIFFKNLSISIPSSDAVSFAYLKGNPGAAFCFCADLTIFSTIPFA